MQSRLMPDSEGGDRSRGSVVARLDTPEPRRVLGWMYIGRLLLATAFALRGPLDPTGASWSTSPFGLLPLAVLFTGLSYAYSHLADRRLSEWFLHGQLVFDALLLTSVVALTGQQQSVFAPLYILLICAGPLLLPARRGTLAGLLAITLYLASVFWSGGGAMSGPVALQVALFVAVALVTGYLAARLKAADAALGEVQSELHQLRLDTGDILETISTGVLTVDGDGRLAFLNPAAAEMLSLSAAEWLGRPILQRLDLIAPGLGAVIARSAEEQIAIRRYETQSTGEDSFVLGVSTTLVEGSVGLSSAVTAIFQDITEKKRMEALRRRAERLEAVAELSASLAHEIKNPLASIRSAVEQIADGSVDHEDALILRSLVVRESDRLSRLLTEFIDFARVKVISPTPVDFGGVVRNAVDLVRSHPDCRGRVISLWISVEESNLWTQGAEDLLHRAVLNLLLNGVQWAGEGGRVEVSLDEVRSDLLSPSLGELSLVRLRVADTGPGIQDDIVEHIFDPFFTRRAGGTGLGLALVQRAVEAHGGAVFVDNSPPSTDLGAMFTLYLPTLAAEVAAGAERSATEQEVAL